MLKPHPIYQVIVDAYAEAKRPFFHQVTPAEARALLRASLAAAPAPANLPAMTEVANETIDGPHGAIPIRRYMPTGHTSGTCVYFHSGGWVIGDLDFSDATCRRLADAARCELISVDYRLAPEHPFPQPLDDAFAAVEWAARRNNGALVISGESSGGNLAAACAIRARDQNSPVIAGQFLAYPVTDDNLDTESYRAVGSRNWLLSTADMRWFWTQYCPAVSDRQNPWASPLKLADAAGLPPALIFVAALDPLRDEGLAYARKLAASNVQVATRCDAGMLHGYLGAAGGIQCATEALAEAASWIRRRLEQA